MVEERSFSIDLRPCGAKEQRLKGDSEGDRVTVSSPSADTSCGIAAMWCVRSMIHLAQLSVGNGENAIEPRTRARACRLTCVPTWPASKGGSSADDQRTHLRHVEGVVKVAACRCDNIPGKNDKRDRYELEQDGFRENRYPYQITPELGPEYAQTRSLNSSNDEMFLHSTHQTTLATFSSTAWCTNARARISLGIKSLGNHPLIRSRLNISHTSSQDRLRGPYPCPPTRRTGRT